MNLKSAVVNRAIVYPESDGKPLAENTKQLRWIVVLYGNLAALFYSHPDVFVGSDLFWYPEEGHSELRIAPDVLVVFGRPKGDRPSYMQWEEGNVPLTVVFEILSPGNTFAEMINKEAFYEDHGVEEYYIYDPDTNQLWIYLRQGTVLRRVHQEESFVSPRLGIRFKMTTPEMTVYGPDGLPFLSFEQTKALLEEARKSAADAQQQAEQAQQQAEQAQQQAEHAQQQAEHERQLRLAAAQRTVRLAELSRKARRQQASPEELQELERLEDEAASS